MFIHSIFRHFLKSLRDFLLKQLLHSTIASFHDNIDCHLREPFAAWFKIHVHIARYRDSIFVIGFNRFVQVAQFLVTVLGKREGSIKSLEVAEEFFA